MKVAWKGAMEEEAKAGVGATLEEDEAVEGGSWEGRETSKEWECTKSSQTCKRRTRAGRCCIPAGQDGMCSGLEGRACSPVLKQTGHEKKSQPGKAHKHQLPDLVGSRQSRLGPNWHSVLQHRSDIDCCSC